MNPDWAKLEAMASDEVRKTLAALPRKLRQAARTLPVTFEPRPSQELVEDGVELDDLGLFVGGERDVEEHSAIPPRIILFLENIWLMVDEEGGGEADFRAEVRTTLMHEFGHYLGLDEDDLEERGLE